VKSELLRFPGPTGVSLAARLDRPDDRPPAAYALFAHCFTCSKDLSAAAAICRELAARDVAVLRVDFTGLGESGGDFAATNFSSNLEDLVAAADFLRREHSAPRLLVGHSLGGIAVLAAAPRIAEAVAVATIGAPSGTRHLREKLLALAAGSPGAPAEDDLVLDLGGLRPVRIRRQLLDDLDREPLREALPALHRALLLFHSPADNVVGIEHAKRLFLAARHPKSFVSLGTADHLLRDPRDSHFAGSVLAAWAERYLYAEPARIGLAGRAVRAEPAAPSELPDPALAGPPEPAPGEVLVAGFGPDLSATSAAAASAATSAALATAATSARSGPAAPAPPGPAVPALTQTVRAGRHVFLIDEPVAVGGGDRGPNPYDILLAALGACTSLTVRMYAALKKWPLAGILVRLRHSKVHAADCVDCLKETSKLDHIDVALELDGDLTPEQRARLLEIAGHCPVHRTLLSDIQIETRLSGS
jgi:uncharacterized OsmC-like protein/alpha/beta superfamily hydrolase